MLIGPEFSSRGCSCLLDGLCRSYAAMPRTRDESDIDELEWDNTGKSQNAHCCEKALFLLQIEFRICLLPLNVST